VAVPGAFAGPAVVADFDGDGQRDRATLDSHQPSLLRVWLSTTQTTSILNAGSPILGVAARDLDGDRRDELMAGGTSGLHVWTTRRKGLRPFPARPVPPRPVGSPSRDRVDDGPEDALAVVLSDGDSLLVLARTPPRGRPSLVSTDLPPGRTEPPISAQALASFGPRPPPFLSL
jgi:hypothetical protein